MFRQIFAVLLVLLFALFPACTKKETPTLMGIGNDTRTPDEFSIQRNKPIKTDIDLSELPTPTLGAQNRVDPRPFEDAVSALGGDPSLVANSKTTRAERNLLKHTSRFGVDPSIRVTLLLEDQEFRRNNKGRYLERAFNVNLYFKAYENEILNPFEETVRFRRAGIKTVLSPPKPDDGK